MKFDSYIGKNYLIFEYDDDYNEYSQVFNMFDMEKVWDFREEEIRQLKEEIKRLKNE